jgi:hypothetical protein
MQNWRLMAVKKILLLAIVLTLASGVAETNAATYLQGRVDSMHSIPCGTQAGHHHRQSQMLCEQYVIRTMSMAYVIRQEVPRKVNVLPVGQTVYFRVKKNRMLVKGYSLNGEKIKNQEYVVISERQASAMTGTP